MSILSRESKPKETRSFFRANPVLSRLSKITERTETDAATYTGIATKVSYFLGMTLVGMIVQLIVKATLGQDIWQSLTIYDKFTVTLSMKETVILVAAVVIGFIAELLGIFVRKTVPVAGSIYSVCQGYVISFLVFKVLTGYEYIGLEALLLTVAVVAVMSWLYSSGIIQANSRFRTVMLSLVIGSIAFGLLTFAGSLIPATRPYVQAMMHNSVLVIALDIIGLVIASLFLISDFSTIDSCVKEGYPKEYEWSAAFGLVFTVIWIYLKILDLLMEISGKNKD